MKEIIKFLIHSDGKYQKWENEWETVSLTPPDDNSFISQGMSSLSALKRNIVTIEIPMNDNGSSGETLGNGKVFKEKIDLTRFIDIRGISVK